MRKKNLLMVKFEFDEQFLCFSISQDFSSDSSSTNQPKIRIQLKYDNGKLFVMVRYANNLVRLKNKLK